MDITVFAAVLCAALLHAAWNAVVKTNNDKFTAMFAVVVGQGILAAASLPFVPVPDPKSWPYLIFGVVLHFGYQIFLANSYRFGDLSQVYPIARGSAPLIVAIISVLLLGVTLPATTLWAVALISTGIMSLALTRGAQGLRDHRSGALALITGCFIAGYSLVDGFGARIAGTATGYWVWLAAVNSAIYVVFAIGWRGVKTVSQVMSEWRVVVIGGLASFLAYWLVVWGFTQAPIAAVSALRETSIVFALLLGVVVLREPLSLRKLFSTFATLVGAAVLRLAR